MRTYGFYFFLCTFFFLVNIHSIILQIVRAWIGTMFGLYALKKVFSGSSDEAPVEKHAAVVQTSASTEENAIPSILSEEFEEWSKVPGNMKKWEDSLKDYDFSKMKA